MELGEIFQNAFDYSKKMASDAGRWIILVILGVIPIVNLIVFGYASKVIVLGIADEYIWDSEALKEKLIERMSLFFDLEDHDYE